jgi:hypothetical protein
MAALWVLNLDAELELARPRGYQATRAVRAQCLRAAEPARALLEPGDRELAADAPPGSHAGRSGRAWCPTPSALAALRAAGAEPEPAPSVDVLRRVIARGFASAVRAQLSAELPGAGHAVGAAAVHARLERAQPGSVWLLKRDYSMAGRGRRRVTAGALTGADESWIEAACVLGGLQVEPWVALVAEFALHGRLARDGTLERGAPCVQLCDARGSWRSTRRARPGEASAAELAALDSALELSAAALERAGWFGPFGIDAYRHAAGFQPLSELNARYSLGWAVGFGRCASVAMDEVAHP